jgi:two-component system, response regulator
LISVAPRWSRSTRAELFRGPLIHACVEAAKEWRRGVGAIWGDVAVSGPGGNPGGKPLRFLVADDDEDDWEFITNAFTAIGSSRVTFVHNGQELLDYLRKEGAHAGRANRDDPDLVLLDLKMPRMGGAETLSEIRADPSLRRLPIVVLTTSTSEYDVNDTYERGANSVISKPSSFIALVEVLRGVRSYWADVAHLPTSAEKPTSMFPAPPVVLRADAVEVRETRLRLRRRNRPGG